MCSVVTFISLRSPDRKLARHRLSEEWMTRLFVVVCCLVELAWVIILLGGLAALLGALA